MMRALLQQGGLKAVTLQNDIRQRLQKAGVKVFTERERLAAPAGALLVVRLDAVHDRIGQALSHRARSTRKKDGPAIPPSSLTLLNPIHIMAGIIEF